MNKEKSISEFQNNGNVFVWGVGCTKKNERLREGVEFYMGEQSKRQDWCLEGMERQVCAICKLPLLFKVWELSVMLVLASIL